MVGRNEYLNYTNYIGDEDTTNRGRTLKTITVLEAMQTAYRYRTSYDVDCLCHDFGSPPNAV